MTKEERKEYNKKNKDKYKGRYKEYMIEWRMRNKNKSKIYNDKNYIKQYTGKNNTLKNKYGITSEEYNKLFEKQNGNCGICEKHQSELKRRLCIDHDHETGKIRGLLCHHCNFVLGHAKDQVNILNKAVLYLKVNQK